MHPQTNGAIAQLVEQRTENPCVPGSSPGGTTKKPAIIAGFFVVPPCGAFLYVKGYEKRWLIATSPPQGEGWEGVEHRAFQGREAGRLPAGALRRRGFRGQRPLVT